VGGANGEQMMWVMAHPQQQMLQTLCSQITQMQMQQSGAMLGVIGIHHLAL
jgi:hypothetical protein